MKYHLISNLITSHNVTFIGPTANAAQFFFHPPLMNALRIKEHKHLQFPRNAREISHDRNIL